MCSCSLSIACESRPRRRVGVAGQLLALVGQLDLLLLLVEREVVVRTASAGPAVGPVVDDLLLRRGRAGWPGDDERRPGLVDEDVVGLVHQGVVVAALDVDVLRACCTRWPP